jgi:homoserine O-acetyltransferase
LLVSRFTIYKHHLHTNKMIAPLRHAVRGARGCIPAALLGGGNRIYTNGSGIGSDSSMISANHRCQVKKFATTTLSNKTIASSIHCLINNVKQNRSFSSNQKTGMDDEYGEMTAEGHTYMYPGSYVLENGQTLENAQLRYMTYGTLNETRDNVLVVTHALTGNASLHSWWGDLLGPGLAFDTDKYFIVCSNILGSCYGSTGPTSPKDGKSGEAYGILFPDVSVRDTVRLQLHMLRDDLRVKSIKCVIGGSFGGMQAVEYAAQAGAIDSPFSVDDESGRATPFIRTVMPIACGAAHTAWQIAISEVQRQAIYSDPKWNDGNPSMDDPPLKGLSVARQIGMVSYRTPSGYESKFGRNLREKTPVYGSNAKWEVKSYLEYQGYKFLSRFDPITYVKLTEQMDTHDVGRGRGGKEAALQNIKIPVLVLGIDSDILYPLDEQKELATLFPNGELSIIHSDAGHDGFLLEQDQVAAHITKFLLAHE